ncbi:cell division protein FtsZ, partial [uncultured Eudoraea sp.]|uniref:cell division protein FtsZ n=1 Tax=uncultured Eudoraea sp. TaxID=1035614 RepID=UPI002639E1D2
MSKNTEFENIAFDLPKNQSNVIKVIGVGGGGSNAINHMFQAGINGVDFVICNTDSQALQNSPVPNKIQLGVSLTEGLGAGANPEVGEQAALESMEEIKQMLDNTTKMIFITAGMGGGTGTGAAPVIAKQAKEMDVLTVGIVTMPFQFEGKMRCQQAQIGIEKLRSNVDSLIVINNNKLREVYGNLGFKAGFSKADEVLSTAARGIAEVITHHYTQNIDLRDAKTVLSNSGTAIMGSAAASGQNRAHEAILKALDSPLLNDNKITGAKNVLLLIVSGTQEITIDEIGEINDHIQNEAGHGANIIMGVGEDESLEEAISVTIIATGFNIEQQNEISNTEMKKVVHALEDDQHLEQDLSTGDKDPAIILPDIELNAKPEEEVVRHTLDLSELDDDGSVESDVQKVEKDVEMDLIPTSELIKNIQVEYQDLSTEQAFEHDLEPEFIVTNMTPEVQEEAVEEPNEEEQITLTFDLPINQTKKDKAEDKELVKFDLDENVKDIKVKDYIELIPVTEASDEGESHYALDSYIEMESSMNTQDAASNSETETDEEIVFEKKVIE